MASRRDMRSGDSGSSRRGGNSSGMSRRDIRASGGRSNTPITRTGPRYRSGSGDSSYQGNNRDGHYTNRNSSGNGTVVLILLGILVLLIFGICKYFNIV